MLANSLADVVAEEAAKRLLPDLNLERKAKWAERVGVGVAKRLALVQADIWAKRSEAGDIYELDPLLVEETTCTRTAFSTLVDELAHQGHLLVRHNKGPRCKVCNVYRAYKQFKFWSSHPCVPRPSAAAVISLFQNKKRKLINTAAGNSRHVLDHCGAHNQTSNKHDGTSSAHTVTRNITLCLSLLSLNLIPYTLSNVVTTHFLKLQSRVHGYDMEGKRRRIASFDDTGGPRAPLQSNFDDPEAFSEEECAQQDVAQHMVPVSGRPIIMCGTLGCSGSCSLSAVEYGYGAGKKPATCQICGRIFPCPNSRNVSPVTSRRSSVVSWSDSPRDQAVSKSVEEVMKDCTEAHQIWNDTPGEQSRNQVGTAVPAAILLVSLSQVSTPLPRVASKIA